MLFRSDVYSLMDSLNGYEVELFSNLFARRNRPVYVRGVPKITKKLIGQYLGIVESVDESIIDSMLEHDVIEYSPEQINPRTIYEIRINEDFYRHMRLTYKENDRLSTSEREIMIFKKIGFPEDRYDKEI